jgi:RES domain-containing protein
VVDEPVLYLAGTPTLAVAENLRLASLFGVQRFPPRLLVTVEVNLTRVVDLRVPHVRSEYGVSLPDLTAEWRDAGGSSPTQVLGSKLVAEGVEGAIYPSSVEPGTANLAVFVRNLTDPDAVRLVGYKLPP